MDPNQTLKNLRAIAERHARVRDGAETYQTHEGDILDDMVEMFNALDGWMRKGGVLPETWRFPG